MVSRISTVREIRAVKGSGRRDGSSLCGNSPSSRLSAHNRDLDLMSQSGVAKVKDHTDGRGRCRQQRQILVPTTKLILIY
jgi:hypothetical protein